MSRDMTQKEFDAALERYDIGKPRGPLGYCSIPPDHNMHVCPCNAGDRRRDQLAYLLKAVAEREKELDEKSAAAAIRQEPRSGGVRSCPKEALCKAKLDD